MPNPQTHIGINNNNVIGTVADEEEGEISDSEESDIENVNEDKKIYYQSYREKIN